MAFGRWRVAVLFAASAAFFAPGALGHAAEDPLPIEVEVLADEGEDAFYYYDGYDLYNLFVREGDFPEFNAAGEPTGPPRRGGDSVSSSATGLVFRFTLYGGFAPWRSAEALHIDITLTGPAGEKTFRVSTPDDQQWSGDAAVIATEIIPDDLPYPGVTAKLQVFVPYGAVGAQVGEVVSAISLRSYADGDLLDVAPGGYFVPNSGGQAEVPAESVRLVEDIVLRGPVGYANITSTVDGEYVTFRVQNPFKEFGQHFHIKPDATPGWAVTLPDMTAANVDGGNATEFRVHVLAGPDAAQPLGISIASDLGGLDRRWIGVSNGTMTVAETSQGLAVVPVAPLEVDSPATTALALLAIALAVLVRRR